jgi:hypothetical protein
VNEPLFAALAALWQADAACRACLGDPVRVYDAAPPGAIFPHAAIAQWRARPFNAGGMAGEDIVLELAVLSRRSRAQAAACAATLAAAADGYAAQGLTGAFVQGTDLARDRDGVTWRATLKLKLLAHP